MGFEVGDGVFIDERRGGASQGVCFICFFCFVCFVWGLVSQFLMLGVLLPGAGCRGACERNGLGCMRMCTRQLFFSQLYPGLLASVLLELYRLQLIEMHVVSLVNLDILAPFHKREAGSEVSSLSASLPGYSTLEHHNEIEQIERECLR